MMLVMNEILVAVAVEVARGDSHAAFGVAGGVEGGSGQQPFVGEGAVAAIDPQLIRGGVVGDVEIQPAVAVVVSGRHAEARAVGLADPGRGGRVREPAVSLVAVERGGHRLVGSRAAVVARADRVVADLVGREREVEVAGNEEIQPAVAVVIHECGARAPQRFADAGLGRDVGKGAVAVVAIERRAFEAGHEEVGPLVVVVIADRDAHAVTAEAHAGRRGHVRKSQRALAVGRDRQVVPKQPASRAWSLPCRAARPARETRRGRRRRHNRTARRRHPSARPCSTARSRR